MRYSPQMLDRKHLKSGCPEKSGKPDFIGLGTPKAGTSWWYQLLVEHPKIKDNDFRVKETCYFCHPWDNDENNAALAHYETSAACQGNSLSVCTMTVINHTANTSVWILRHREAFYSPGCA